MQNPSSKVADLLGRKKSVLTTGIQQPREDWTAVAVEVEFEDKYAFSAKIVAAKALKPQILLKQKVVLIGCCGRQLVRKR